MEVVVIDGDKEALAAIPSFLSRMPSVDELKAFLRVEDSLGYLDDRRVDLVLLDADGGETHWMVAMKRIQSLHTETKVILMSRTGDLAAKAYELGVWDYLLKPVKPHQLERILSKAAARL